MSISQQPSQVELERMLVEAESEAATLRRVYVSARSIAIAATLKKRDFHYCQQSILGEEDEDLNVAIMHETEQAQAAHRRARDDYLQAKRVASIIRQAMRPQGSVQGVGAEGGTPTL